MLTIRHGKRPMIILVSLILALVVLLGCGPTTPTPPTPPTTPTPPTPTVPSVKKPEGTLRVTLPAPDLETMLPERGTTTSIWLRRPIYDTLIMFDPGTASFQPMLATEWTNSPDHTKWTFKLRKGVKFHNGDEFTAEDVKFTLERLMSDKSRATGKAYWVRALTKVEIVDPYTISFEFSGWMQAGWLMSSWQEMHILDKKYVEAVGLDEAEKHPVGTGPFKLKEWKLGESITLEAVEDHYRKTPEYKYLVITFVDEPSTRLARLMAGEADLIELTQDQVASVEKVKGLRVVKDPLPIHGTLLALNGQYLPTRATYDPACPFLDKRLREALNLAINREELIKEFVGGMAIPMAARYAYPGYLGWRDEFKPYPYDPEEAKRLVKEAFPHGVKFEYWISPDQAEGTAFHEAIASYWSAIGVTVEMKVVDKATATAKRRAKQMSGIVEGMVCTMYAPEGLENPIEYVYFSWGSAPQAEREDMDALGKKLLAESDPKVRDDIYASMYKMFIDEYLAVPIMYYYSMTGVRDSAVAEFNNLGLYHPEGFEYIKKP